MAIEKMALVSIEGALRRVNKTLMRCCESECFHIIPSTHVSEGHFSSQSFKTLKDKNLYGPLVKRGQKLAEGLGIEIRFMDYDDIDYTVSIDFDSYFGKIEKELKSLAERRESLQTSLQQHTAVLTHVEQMPGLNSDFEDLFALKYTKVRFGRLPYDSYAKLRYFEDRNFMFFPFETLGDYLWGVYFVPDGESVMVDDIFKSLYFERIIIPDYVTGNSETAKAGMQKLIQEESDELDEVNEKIASLRQENEEKFIKVFCKLRAIDESYELRANVSVINNRFFLSGYIPMGKVPEFTQMIEAIEQVEIQLMPPDSDPTVEPPVRLKNNWFIRPFEMFVNMYGLPTYGKIDPTPFVAITYFIIYGMMFGDVGQGLLISLFGFVLRKWKNPKLAPIMERIGISSMIFGFLYGSVFGNEHIIKPFFHHKPVYEMLGFETAPENIFKVSSFLIIGALAVGVFIIILTMVMNIISCMRFKNFEKGFLGSSGVCGLVLYSSVVAGAVGQLALGFNVFTPMYVVTLIVIPVLLMFFREPIAALFEFVYKKLSRQKINRNMSLVNSIKVYSDAISNVDSVAAESMSLEELFDCRYINHQYGKMAYESYEKLALVQNKEFFFFPFESDDHFVSGIYIAARDSFPSVDKTFASLGFLKMKTPAHISDIRKVTAKTVTVEQTEEEKLSVGSFVIEGFIDIFETALTYVTNTMSFMRIGGFIMSHAGLMLVVNILAEKLGGDGGMAWWITQIIGNLFVLGLEGFLVGIQVVRLEFYEMFSRFYEGKGKPFKPIVVDLKITD